MGIMGFPSEGELASMMGFVSDEDRKRWEQMKAESDARIAASGKGLSARNLAAQAASPAMSMAERSVTAGLHAARNEQARDTQAKRMRNETRTVTYTSSEPVSSDEYEHGY